MLCSYSQKKRVCWWDDVVVVQKAKCPEFLGMWLFYIEVLYAFHALRYMQPTIISNRWLLKCTIMHFLYYINHQSFILKYTNWQAKLAPPLNHHYCNFTISWNHHCTPHANGIIGYRYLFFLRVIIAAHRLDDLLRAIWRVFTRLGKNGPRPRTIRSRFTCYTWKEMWLMSDCPERTRGNIRGVAGILLQIVEDRM